MEKIGFLVIFRKMDLNGWVFLNKAVISVAGFKTGRDETLAGRR